MQFRRGFVLGNVERGRAQFPVRSGPWRDEGAETRRRWGNTGRRVRLAVSIVSA